MLTSKRCHFVAFVAIILSMASTKSFSQTLKIDSLTSLLNDSGDSSQVNIRLELFSLVSPNGDQMRTYAEQVLEIGRLNSDKLVQSKGLVAMGVAYYYLDADKSLQYYKEGAALCDEIDNEKDEARARYGICTIYLQQETWDLLLEEALKAYDVAKRVGNDNVVNLTKNIIGLVYSYNGDIDLADKYFKEALEYFQASNDRHSESVVYNNLGYLREKQGKYKEALEFTEKALALKEELGMPIVIQLHNIGLMEAKLNNLERSNRFYFQAAEKAKGSSQEYMLPQIYYDLGYNFLKKEKLDEALKWAKLSYDITNREGSRRRLDQIIDLLYRVYMEKSDYKNALYYQGKLLAIKDSLAKVDHRMAMRDLEVKFNREEQKEELTQLKSKFTEYQYFLKLCGAVLVVGVLGTALLFYLEKKRVKIIKARLLVEEQRLTEIEKREEILQREVQRRNQELTSISLNLIQKDEVLADLKQRMEDLKGSESQGAVKSELTSLISSVNIVKNLDKGWDNFKLYFDKVNPNFFENLSRAYPELTANDLKVCALLKMNLGTKDISSIMDISPDSAKAARHRIRKKLGLPQDQNLTSYLNKFEYRYDTAMSA